MIKDLFVLATKNLKHRGFRSWLTLLGIFIGVAAVVSLISLGNGLQLAVSSQFGISSTEVLTVKAGGVSMMGAPGTGVTNFLDIKDLQAVENLASVEMAISRNIVSGKIEFNDKVSFVMMTNIPDGEERKFVYEQLDIEPVTGRFLKDGERGKVFLGYNYYADKAGFDKIIVPGNTILIQDIKFEVIGIADKKGSMMLDGAVYMNELDLEEIDDYGDEMDLIVVRVKDEDLMGRAKEDVERVLRRTRDVKIGEEDFEVSTPDAAMATVNDILAGVQAFIVIIASISIFIGALGIVNTMTTSVLERKKEIGIMKSIGATNQNIFLQFFIESSLLGLVGGVAGAVIGTAIGLLGTAGINSFMGAEVAPSINFYLIFSALVGSFIIGGIAGIIPAMNAAKQNPVEALSS